MSNGSGLFGNQGPALPHLVQGSGGLAGEVADLRADIGRVMAPMTALTVDEFTNPTGLAAPGVAVILAATATVAAPVTVLAAGMLAAGLAHLTAWPRPLTFTTSGGTAADAPATVLITGTSPTGAAQTETLALAQTATTVTSVNAWSSITKVDYPAADGTGALVSIGVAAAYVKKATATVAAIVTLSVANLIQTNMAINPRALVFTTAGGTAADAPANAVITGKGVHDRVISETLVLAQTATSVTSANYYKSVTSIVYPAADGTGATIAITPSAAFGVSKKVVARAGLAAPVREIAAGAVVTNGVLTAPTTANLPYGSYAPNTVADGANDYATYFEYDPTAA